MYWCPVAFAVLAAANPVSDRSGRSTAFVPPSRSLPAAAAPDEPSSPPAVRACLRTSAPFSRPVHTYSIVARDPQTGEMGVAVQSHWFSVGPIVPWAEAGVGAVATQSLADPAYGPLGLELMRRGKAAPDALAGLLASDAQRDVRQVAMIDAQGRVAVHTGARCIAQAGDVCDPAAQFSVQANLMEKDTVWPAMAEAYRRARGDLAERMLAALEAAEREGGDIRGRQSAAIVIVRGQASGRPWKDRQFDLRVEDHPQPIAELRRLVQLQRAYNHMNAGDEALEHGDMDAANREYTAAARHAPDIVEIPFWQAVTLANKGRLDDALPVFADVFRREPKWREVVPRLVPAGLLPRERDVLRRILSEGRR